MKCTYCYEGQKKVSEKYTKERATDLLHYLHTKIATLTNDNDLVVNFHGGEPLLAFDTIQYITEELLATYGKKVRFGVTTNGLLLTDTMIDFLCKHFDYNLSISIDGTKRVHDFHRKLHNGTGSYDIILPHVKKLLAKRKDLRGRMTFNATTVLYLFESIKHMYDLGFSVIIPVPDYFDKGWNRETFAIFEQEFTKITSYFTPELRHKEGLEIGLLRDNTSRLKNGCCNPRNCAINISAAGELYPCSYTVGNRAYCLGDILNGVDEDKIDEIINLSKEPNPSCTGCTNYQYCHATRCKLVNKALTGEYHTPSGAFCAFEHIFAGFNDYGCGNY